MHAAQASLLRQPPLRKADGIRKKEESSVIRQTQVPLTGCENGQDAHPYSLSFLLYKMGQ